MGRRVLRSARARRFAVALVLLTVGALSRPGGSSPPGVRVRPADLSAHTRSPTNAPGPTAVRLQETYGRLPLSFEENRGQTDARVKFLSRSKGYALFLTDTGATLSLQAPAAAQATSEASMSGRRGAAASGGGAPRAFKEARRTAVTMSLLGAQKHPRISAVDALPGHVNYFRGNDRAKWRTDIPTYARVRYEQVYPGIDLVYYGTTPQVRLKPDSTTEGERDSTTGAQLEYGTTPQVRLKPDSTTNGELEYDFIVAPGADPNQIQLSFDGIDELRIDDRGDLVLTTAVGQVRQHKPIIYQEIDGARVEIAGGYQLVNPEIAQSNRQIATSPDRQIVAFSVADYDRARRLVIDPTLIYSTFLGGNASDEAHGIAVDSTGAAYVAGRTSSVDFPTTPGALDESASGPTDAFVAKVNAAGTALVYTTFLGGSDDEAGFLDFGIAVDATGAAYVTGATRSTDFPTTPGAYDVTHNAGATPDHDVFITKLHPAGNTLVYSTFLGGSSVDEGTAIVVDAAGAAYVTGRTASNNFPTTPGAFLTTAGSELFVAKLNAAGSALVYSTFLDSGGIGFYAGTAIAIDATGAAYVTGQAGTGLATTPGAFNPTNEPGDVDDAFVTKLNAAGSALVYSTRLGGPFFDAGGGIAVDATGAAYVTGTTSGGFPTTPGAFDTTANGGISDAFVTKLNASGSALIYSTYLGGSGNEGGRSIAVDATGAAYVTGQTGSSNFPTTPGAFDTSQNGDLDAFVTKLNAAGSALVYSTFLGGSGSDQGRGIAIDATSGAYIAGLTGSGDFPTTPGAFDEGVNGGGDAFVAEFSFGGTLTVTKTLAPAADPGKFNLQIDGVTAGTGANVGNGGTTGVVTVNPGAHIVTETAGTAISLADYITTIDGDCAPDGSITLAVDDIKTCTVTNARKPRLTVTKVLVPSGDPGTFNLLIDGVTAGTGANVGNGGTTGVITLDTLGLHTVGETAGTATSLSNYLTVIGGDCLSNGNITLSAGDNKVCAITNYRKVEMTSLTTSSSSIFPADRRMVTVTLAATTLNPATCQIASVVQNTPQLGSQPDYILHLPLSVELRAERPTGNTNRSYVINLSCTDGFTIATANVSVNVLGVR